MTEITLQKNQKEFTIGLNENPTTGYVWSIKELDSKALQLVNKTFEQKNEQLMGAGGRALFNFKVLKGFKDKTKLCLIYKRPWEKKGGEERSFLIKRKSAQGAKLSKE